MVQRKLQPMAHVPPDLQQFIFLVYLTYTKSDSDCYVDSRRV